MKKLLTWTAGLATLGFSFVVGASTYKATPMTPLHNKAMYKHQAKFLAKRLSK